MGCRSSQIFTLKNLPMSQKQQELTKIKGNYFPKENHENKITKIENKPENKIPKIEIKPKNEIPKIEMKPQRTQRNTGTKNEPKLRVITSQKQQELTGNYYSVKYIYMYTDYLDY